MWTQEADSGTGISLHLRRRRSKAALLRDVMKMAMMTMLLRGHSKRCLWTMNASKLANIIVICSNILFSLQQYLLSHTPKVIERGSTKKVTFSSYCRVPTTLYFCTVLASKHNCLTKYCHSLLSISVFQCVQREVSKCKVYGVLYYHQLLQLLQLMPAQCWSRWRNWSYFVESNIADDWVSGLYW